MNNTLWGNNKDEIYLVKILSYASDIHAILNMTMPIMWKLKCQCFS